VGDAMTTLDFPAIGVLIVFGSKGRRSGARQVMMGAPHALEASGQLTTQNCGKRKFPTLKKLLCA
jgi:hypothetical protein